MDLDIRKRSIFRFFRAEAQEPHAIEAHKNGTAFMTQDANSQW